METIWQGVFNGLMGMIRAGVEGGRDIHGHWSRKLEAGKSCRDTVKKQDSHQHNT